MISAVQAGLSHKEEHVSFPRINPLYWRLRDTLIIRHTVKERMLTGESTALCCWYVQYWIRLDSAGPVLLLLLSE